MFMSDMVSFIRVDAFSGLGNVNSQLFKSIKVKNIIMIIFKAFSGVFHLRAAEAYLLLTLNVTPITRSILTAAHIQAEYLKNLINYNSK